MSTPATLGGAPSAPAHWRTQLGLVIGRIIFYGLYRSRTWRSDLVPRTGPVILAANHSAFVDGPLVFGVAPRASHFLVKVEMFHGFVGWVLRTVGQIPIDRKGMDRTALLTAVDALKRGGVVGVFPEGARGRGDVAQVQEGVTWLAMQTGATIVPVACLGSRHPSGDPDKVPPLRSRMAVVFGTPLTLEAPAGVPRREASRLLTEQLRQALAAHVVASSELTGIPLTAGDVDPRDMA